MLVLSRRPGDAILIDGGIRIVVLASDQRMVRLGIDAPLKVGILREEIALHVDPGLVSGPGARGSKLEVQGSEGGGGRDAGSVSGSASGRSPVGPRVRRRPRSADSDSPALPAAPAAAPTA